MMAKVRNTLTEQKGSIQHLQLLQENEKLHKTLKNTEMMIRIQQEAVRKYKQQIEILKNNDTKNKSDFDREFDGSEFHTQKSYCFSSNRKAEEPPRRLMSQSSAELTVLKKSGVKTSAQFTAKALQRYLNTEQNVALQRKNSQQETQDSITRVRTLRQLKAQAIGVKTVSLLQIAPKNENNNPEPKATRRTSYFDKLKNQQN